MDNSIKNIKTIQVGNKEIAKYLIHGEILFLKIITKRKKKAYADAEKLFLCLIQYSEKKIFTSIAYLNV